MTLCESVICRFDQNNKSEALASFFCAFFAKIEKIDWKDQPNPIRVGFYKSSFPAPIKLKSRKTIIVLQLFFDLFFQSIFSVYFFSLFFQSVFSVYFPVCTFSDQKFDQPDLVFFELFTICPENQLPIHPFLG